MNNPYNQNPYQQNPYNQNPYGYGQPSPAGMNPVYNNTTIMFAPPPPAPSYPAPQPHTLVYIDKSPNELPCPLCGTQTQTIMVRKAGGVTFLWCCCLLWLTGVCCCLPFFIDSCLDAHLICVRCNHAKQIIPANCL